ncbi:MULTISPECIES: proton extrusion protein PcxA [unclassified Synechococcus]|mgnify:FL=1|uniref:proton extrusion protein PcxA n=1 Tax=unclassified Synechococcus TaxID=2626047 RepID=UPI001CF9027C|nr:MULTISPECIES: proton extrusion protein PcxA [unclassified Synechococcus]MCB4410889.1 proton extrusion protein PcxA [Synechococcus sp. MU1611]
MSRRNWINLFSSNQSVEFSSDLERGYEAALLIQSLELEYYGDRQIRPDLKLSVPRAVQATILRRFKTALAICRNSAVNLSEQRAQLDSQELRQLQLIETVVSRYGPRRSSGSPSISRSPDALPRSLLGVFDSIRLQLDPSTEDNVVAGYRRRRDSTLISLRVLLLLILVPLLVQQIAGTYLISPAVNHFSPELPFLSYPKPQLEEKAAEKLRLYKQELEFDAFLKGVPPLDDVQLRDQLTEKATELKHDADEESLKAIKNVFADLAGLIAFAVVCLISRDELRVLRGFVDEAVYGLSDSAKAFAIILFTDIFVGYHSPEGWSVLLDGIAEHFGLPSSQSFVNLFIATFPVVLATIFKYWIFRYLNRVSPSSVATLKGMNGSG